MELKKIKISRINEQEPFISEISKKQKNILSGFGIDTECTALSEYQDLLQHQNQNSKELTKLKELFDDLIECSPQNIKNNFINNTISNNNSHTNRNR